MAADAVKWAARHVLLVLTIAVLVALLGAAVFAVGGDVVWHGVERVSWVVAILGFPVAIYQLGAVRDEQRKLREEFSGPALKVETMPLSPATTSGAEILDYHLTLRTTNLGRPTLRNLVWELEANHQFLSQRMPPSIYQLETRPLGMQAIRGFRAPLLLSGDHFDMTISVVRPPEPTSFEVKVRIMLEDHRPYTQTVLVEWPV